ncbi:MAG: PAS domain S-box protein [Desulfobulbaceae bacterium]|nr:PAS domain S-box protein [Desulfobulbaceae bacterium]
MEQKENKQDKPNISVQLRITLIYVFFGALWILFSDRILFAFVADHQLLTRIAIYKGWTFIAITSMLLYWLINRSMQEQARIAETLRLSEKKFRTLLNRATDAIFVCDLDSHLIDVNKEACRSLGYSRDELLQLSVADVDPEFSFAADSKNQWGQLSFNHTVLRESTHRRKDGSLFPVEIHIGKLLLDDRPVILGVARNISERRQAERAMEQSAMEWVAAMDALDDAICLLDLKRRLLRANTTFYHMTGSTPHTAVGRHISEILHPRGESAPCPVCVAQKEMRDALITMEADHPDNPAGLPLEITAKVIRDQEGRPLSMLMSLHDLTNARKDLEERARLESQLRQAQKMEAIGTLAGGIAHDFNNILTAVLGYAELVREGIKTNSASPAEDIEQVIRGALRARDLVKHILTFSRKGDYKIVPLAPHLIINESLKLLRASIPATIGIQQDIDKDCGTILADPSQLQQVMINLCTNARQAMDKEQGTLVISLKRRELGAAEVEGELQVKPGPFVELTVSDTGQGMDETTMARIFEPYFTTKEFGRGTGLGLAVVHGIVHDCGGMIKVESEVGKGSSFHVYFPVATEKVCRTACQTQDDIPAGHERILAVDDEAAIARYEKSVLEGLGYQVTAMTSSLEAWEILRSSPYSFDLLLTDQTMPAMPGTVLAAKVLAIRPDMPVILCTGYSAVVNAEKIQEMGIRLLAMKPFDQHELARLVRKALDEK